MSSLPPPTYDEQRTQLLISPSPGAIQFQKGFLGAQGERAAIEGELQIKGAEDGQWDNANISLQTLESNSQQSIEISSSTLVLFSRASGSSTASSNTIPSTLPFSIPLTPDTPQCIHMAHSSISHLLVATLHPADATAPALTKTILVHTRRYTSPNRPLLLTRPYVIQREDPISVKVEVPRTTFRIGEPIAVYITIPPPDVNIIMARGLRLRNVMADLVRVVSLGQAAHAPGLPADAGASVDTSINAGSSMQQRTDEKSELTYPPLNLHESVSTTDGLHTIVTRSGSSCRFHTSRSVQVRLLLYPHQSAVQNVGQESMPHNHEQIENENSDCTSITQSTLLHTVSFHISVNTTFMFANSHSESVTRVTIPIVLLPNPAPLPEVDESVASDYRKKHDKPPVRTVRHEDADLTENEAGPSALNHSGAPPPFEERDAPPPFFTSDPTASTSSRLPTFLESESDLGGHISNFQPVGSQITGSRRYISIPGEGTEFGFNPDDQYDGISSSLDRSTSPPPSLANANLDTDVTEFANLTSIPEHTMEALNLALDQPVPEAGSTQPSSHSQSLPPPPPLLDDPSDPPPSIDVEEFRRPPALPLSRERSPPRSSVTPTPRSDASTTGMSRRTPSANAPPPYLHPPEEPEPEGTVTRPPPYVDVLPVAGSH